MTNCVQTLSPLRAWALIFHGLPETRRGDLTCVRRPADRWLADEISLLESSFWR